MVRRPAAPLLILAASIAAGSGCASGHRIAIALPAMPAVSLVHDGVAVVAGSRDCRPVADALVDQLNATPGLVVDPRAEVRFEVIECANPRTVNVDVTVTDGVAARSLSVDGSAYALMVVRQAGVAEAHVIGAARREVGGTDHGAFLLSRFVEKELSKAVAEDLADQVRPVPRFVERWVYDHPAPGTPQQWFNDAVLAESQGDLGRARDLAQAAHAARPSSHTEAYVAELDALVARYGSTSYNRLP